MSFAVVEMEPRGALASLAEMDQAALDALPMGIYFCDAEGKILRANRTAEELWGRKLDPSGSVQRFCNSFRVESLNGIFIPPDQTPMALAIRDGASFRNVEARVENPDGRRWVASVTIQPLTNARGEIAGAINCFRDVTHEHEQRETMTRQQKCFDLAMIASKMGTWRYTMADNICIYDENAQRLYGLSGERFLHDEDGVRSKFHPDDMELMWSRVAKACDPAGDGLYDVQYRVRQPDGSWRWLSAWGTVEFEGEGAARKPVAMIGASRDISGLVKADEAQKLLINELHHRVKNLFALASGVVSLSARTATTPKDLAHTVGERLGALARAHALTLPSPSRDNAAQSASLQALLATIVSPYEGVTPEGRPRIAVSGIDVPIVGQSVTSFALLLHEFATNAAKYGALSVPGGHVEITSLAVDDKVLLTWRERGGPAIDGPVSIEGFGSLLTRMVSSQLGGQIARDWHPDGLSIQLSVDSARLH